MYVFKTNRQRNYKNIFGSGGNKKLNAVCVWSIHWSSIFLCGPIFHGPDCLLPICSPPPQYRIEHRFITPSRLWFSYINYSHVLSHKNITLSFKLYLTIILRLSRHTVWMAAKLNNISVFCLSVLKSAAVLVASNALRSLIFNSPGLSNRF